MDSGWLAFTILFSIVVLGMLGFSLRSYFTGVGLPISSLAFPFLLLTKVLPIGFLMTGPIMDIINSKGLVSSIPTIATLSALILFKGISMFWAPVPFFENLSSNTSGFWCTLPGFEYFENPFLPSSILTSTIIGLYYIFWASKNNQQLLPVSAISVAAIFGSILQFTLGGCSPYYKTLFGYGGNETIFWSLLVGTAVAGITFGFSTMGGMQNNPLFGINLGGGPAGTGGCPDGSMPNDQGGCDPVPNMAGGTNCPDGTYYSPDIGNGIPGCVSTPGQAGKVNCPTGSTYDPSANNGTGGCVMSTYSSRQSSAPQGEQTFVAELYKNGQMITQSIGK